MLKAIIILVLVIYFLSRIIRFLLPIFRISSVAGDQMRKMQEQMNHMENRLHQTPPQAANNAGQKKNARKTGDYIDYEEVK